MGMSLYFFFFCAQHFIQSLLNTDVLLSLWLQLLRVAELGDGEEDASQAVLRGTMGHPPDASKVEDAKFRFETHVILRPPST